MALVKFGTGVVDMSGSIAGTVYSRNRFGSYVRARVKPVNPRSPRQTGARTVLQYLAEQWRESPMTDLIRQAWRDYSQTVNWVNKLGEAVTLTGYNQFIRGNSVNEHCSGALITAGPVAAGLPPGDPLFQASALSVATQDFTATFDDGFDWCSEDGAFFAMQMGFPQPSSHNFFNGPWRNCAFLAGNNAVPIVSPQAGLTNIGWAFSLGQKVWFRAAILRADGRLSTKFWADPEIAVA